MEVRFTAISRKLTKKAIMTWGLTLQCGVGGGAGEKFCSKRWVRIKIEGVEECCDASMAIDEAQRLISTIRLGVCSMSLADPDQS